MATKGKHSGTHRTDIETDLARLDGFRPVESEWERLLHRTVRTAGDSVCRDEEGETHTLESLLANHVLTVLADIVRKRLTGYGDSYSHSQGTTRQRYYTRKLQEDVRHWINRLETYIHDSRLAGNGKSQSVQVAQEVLAQLSASMPRADEPQHRGYYRMLRTVSTLQANAARYLVQVENSGDADPGLSLLIAYLKNYADIAEAFNQRFAGLPQLYCEGILHIKPQDAVQDNVYLIVRPTERMPLKAGTEFLAGENEQGEALVYQTSEAEDLTPMACNEVRIVRPMKSQAFALGWELSSPMLILNEGERTLEIRMQVTDETTGLLPNSLTPNSFTLLISTESGWTELTASKSNRIDGNTLSFDAILHRDNEAPTACKEEIHGKNCIYPVLRIQTTDSQSAFGWVSRIKIARVEIRTSVSGIRNFTLYNELGEVDTAQPFSPFGIQGERGAGFLFGNEEMGMKPLTRMRLFGVWQKLPATRAEMDKIYSGYNETALSFAVQTEWQQAGRWHSCEGEPQRLFAFDEKGNLKHAEINFDFSTVTYSNEYAKDKDGFFRVTLQAPSIGFGKKTYRQLFIETVTHNSRCKKKEIRPLPVEPSLPLLADVELAYEAADTLTELPEAALFELNTGKQTPYSTADIEDDSLYIALSHAQGERQIKFYLDMALPEMSFYANLPEPQADNRLVWSYRDKDKWTGLSADAILREETDCLTRSGFVEIKLPKKVETQDVLWLRAALKGNAATCLVPRNVWTNCTRVTVRNGNGLPLPANTIQTMVEEDGRILEIIQPMPGFGGKPVEKEEDTAAWFAAHTAHRNRAVNAKDYEQIALEHFPEIEKAVCIPATEAGKPQVTVVVFSRKEEHEYRQLPSWKLVEVEKKLKQHASPFVQLRVKNVCYEHKKITCRAALREEVADSGLVFRQLRSIIRHYIAPWIKNEEIPELGQTFSYRELHARVANHEALHSVLHLDVDGEGLPDEELGNLSLPDFDPEKDLVIKGKKPYSVLIADVDLTLTVVDKGIGEAGIGTDFTIK